MLLFADTANVATLRGLMEAELIDGVTTNPSLLAREEKAPYETVQEILTFVGNPISVEVVSQEYDAIVQEAQKIASLGDQIVVKLPMTQDGLRATRVLSQQRIKTNLTLCFSSTQALLAAKAGATYVSPFVGRLNDVAQDGFKLLEEIRQIFDNYDLNCQILAASIRSVEQVKRAALLGCNALTAPPEILWKLIQHPQTTEGLQKFKRDWGNRTFFTPSSS